MPVIAASNDVNVINKDPLSLEFARAFGAQLVEAGLIDALGAQRAQRAAAASSERFDHVLNKLGLLSEEDLIAQLSVYLDAPLADASDMPDKPQLADIIDQKFIKRHGVLPLSFENGVLKLAACDPLNADPQNALAYLVEGRIELCLITARDFEKAMSALYQNRGDESLALSEIDPRSDTASEFDLQRLRDLANEAPIIRLVNQIIAKAVELGASDIHMEPSLEGARARYRIDGALRTAQTIPPGLQAAVASRVKIMSKLDIAERRLPQDGRIKIAVRGVDIDFRVSTIPTIYGESIVMRILDRRSVELDFVKLGFCEPHIEGLRNLARQPNGIILVTGPTGSGKTTTLYTALKEINRPDSKIFTVEDPIEYQLSGVNQVQVQPAIGFDFPHALRSILRQDPDVIMIGEIRDLETARIAIQASLTGHLVFSTLHTNSAAASITRLIDMGIENYLLASTLKGVLAQRLVRKLCQACAREQEGAETWAERVPQNLRSGAPRFLTPCGCAQCDNIGFKGRSTISELLIVDDDIQSLIHASASEVEIEKIARQSGMRLLYEDGLSKAYRGETSVEEVLRVTRAN